MKRSTFWDIRQCNPMKVKIFVRWKGHYIPDDGTLL
jgi:hypothetical protein